MKTVGILLWWDPRKNVWWAEKVIAEIVNQCKEKYQIVYIFMDNHTYQDTEDGIQYYGIKTIGRSPFNIISFSRKLGFLKMDLLIDNMWATKLFHNIHPKTKIIQICHGVAWWALRNIKIKNIALKIGYYIYYLFFHILRKITYKKAELIITAPKSAPQEIAKYYKVDPKKIINIYNGIDHISQTIKPYDKKLKVIFIGNNHARKGMEILEQTAKNLHNKNVMFKIVGSPYINKKHIQNIHYLGKLTGNEKYQEIYESDVVFMPSNYEGQNLVIMECMWYGCIPLASKNTHVDVVEWTPLQQFISPTNDANFYTAQIEFLLTHPDKIQIMKEQARQLVSKYTRANQAKLYLKEIDKLLK